MSNASDPLVPRAKSHIAVRIKAGSGVTYHVWTQAATLCATCVQERVTARPERRTRKGALGLRRGTLRSWSVVLSVSGEVTTRRRRAADRVGPGHAVWTAGVAAVFGGCISLPLIVLAEVERGPATEFRGVLLVALAAALSGAYPSCPRPTGPPWRYRSLRAAHLASPAVVSVVLVVAITRWVPDASGGVGVAIAAALGAVVGRMVRSLHQHLADSMDVWADELVARFYPAYLAGFALMISATLLAQAPNIDPRTGIAPPPLPAVALSLTVAGYVLAGLATLACVRYARLRAQWRKRAANVTRCHPTRWSKLTLGLVGASGAASLLLGVVLLGGVFSPLFQLMESALAVVLSAPLWLLRGFALTLAPPGKPIPEKRIADGQVDRDRSGQQGQPHPGSINTGLLLLDLAIVALGFAILLWFNRHRLAAVWHWCELQTRCLLRRLGGGRDRGLGWALSRRRIAEGTSPLHRMLAGLGRPLPPRERVLLTYRRLLHAAERSQVGRSCAATPREFGRGLTTQLTGVEGDIDALTEAFVEARYSRHAIAPTTADRVHEGWRRIRHALGQLRR